MENNYFPVFILKHSMTRYFLFSLLLPILSYSQLLYEEDKQIHFLAGTIISTATYTLVYQKTKSKKKAFLYAAASSIVAGTLKEMYDHQQQGNRFDSRDVLATTYGGLSIGVTISLFNKKK